VDVPQTAEKLAQAITFHTGQVCCDATRWLVHESIYDRFIQESIQQLKNVVVGYQMDARNADGTGGQSEAAAAGAELPAARPGRRARRCCWKVARRRWPIGPAIYVKPALLAGSLDNVAAQEEIFGPVAYLALVP
jgi:acyl-CoA reductase-like NAD-dependent aldehyde dehydrogenase